MHITHLKGKFYEERDDYQIENYKNGIFIDFHFSAKPVSKGSDYIYLKVYSCITDSDGKKYVRIVNHSGYYLLWKEAIKGDIEQHLKDLKLPYDLVKSKILHLTINKDCMVKWHSF